MVVRVKLKENILLLNGKGVRVLGEVTSISKGLVEISVQSKEELKPEHDISLAVSMPKKEAFEDILKMAVELGVREIFPLVSEFSQYEYAPSERIDRILESALVQSNNPFFPVIHPEQRLSDFLNKHDEIIVFFNSKKTESSKNQNTSSKKTILIGPEGGFSAEEVMHILNFPKILQVHLPTPILRAPTAVASSVGYLLARD